MRTQITGRTDWIGLVALSRRLTKLTDQHKPRDSLVYIAGHSQGERNVEPTNLLAAHIIQDQEFKGEWRGFREANAEQFVWHSSSRNAELSAKRKGQHWKVKYIGPGYPFF